jgi:hypothetical protein
MALLRCVGGLLRKVVGMVGALAVSGERRTGEKLFLPG